MSRDFPNEEKDIERVIAEERCQIYRHSLSSSGPALAIEHVKIRHAALQAGAPPPF